jgi:sulfate permease, SulP family
MLLSSASRPHVAILGRIPGTQRFSDFDRHPDNELVLRVLIFRIEASLLYFNADHVRRVVWAKIEQSRDLRVVICDLSNSPYVDVAGAAVLATLSTDLAKRSVKFRIVEARAKPRDLLRAVGLEDQVGYFGRHLSIEQAITESRDASDPHGPGETEWPRELES